MTRPSIKKNDPAVSTANDGFLGNLDIEFLIHELKGPLSVLETAVRMLLEKQHKYGPLTDRQARTLERALKSSKKARRLVGDLLEIGRSDAGCFSCQWFDAVSVLSDVILEALEEIHSDRWETLRGAESVAERMALLRRHDIDLRLTASVHGLKLCQDEAKFRQIMGNLIKNALQYRSKHLEIEMDCRDAQVLVDVIDDGPGVDDDHRELIFERYRRFADRETLSRPGHGLGLAGARILARHLGGDITVKGNSRSGAIFCLSLPIDYKA